MSHAIASPAAWAVWPLAAACVAPATSSPDELAVQLARAMKAHPVALPAELRKTRPRWLAAVDCSDVREHGARLTLMALQGLVNREGPRLYLVAMHGFNADADRFWLERFQDEYGIPHRLMSVEEALREFASGLPGVVIWDEDLPVTRNIALMIASLTGYLPVSPVGAARRAVSSEGEIDLRGVFSDHLAAQRWAIERLLPHLDKTNVGCVCERDRSLSLCRDYLVMRGAFMCDLSSSPTHPEERALKAELYSRLAPGAIVWGWTSRDGEGEHVRQASEHGLRVLCSTNSPNLSVFTQLAPKARRFAVRPRPEPPVPERKIYLTFVLSDGDSIPILLTRQWYRWDEQARGRVPFGWELQPLFAELAPVVLEYYYDTASPNDSFIAGPSGAGYVHPSRLPDPGAHMAATRDADKRLGVRVVGIIDEWDADAARAWSRALPGADGFLYGWGAAPGQPLRILGGKPHLHYWLCPPRPDGEKDDAYYAGVASRIRDIARREGKPCFIAAHLSCYWAGPDDVPRIVEALGGNDDCAVVSPGTLCRLVRAHYEGKIVLQVPERLAAIAGLEASLNARLVSMRRERTPVSLEVAGAGLAEPVPETRVTVPPEDVAQASVPLRIAPTGGLLHVWARYGAGAAHRRLHVRPIAAPDGLPHEPLRLQSLWEAEDLARPIGRSVDDPGALNGRAWVAQVGRDEPNGHIVWGQYERPPAGDYRVAFRMKVARRTDDPVAVLDVFNFDLAEAGRDGVLARREINGADFAAADQYQDFWLTLQHGGEGRLEYRVRWLGGADLAVDRIVVVGRSTGE